MPLSPLLSRDEELAALLAAPPPRRVPARWLRAARAQAAPIALAWFGLFFAALGVPLSWAFVPWSYHRDWRLRAADTAQTPGVIVSAENTHSSINDTDVWRYRFRSVQAGPRIGGLCYTTGARWRAGDGVMIHYRPENPRIACPLGARTSQGSLASAFSLIFPVIGVGLMAWVGLSRRRASQVLQRGVVAEALVASLDATGSQVNYQPVYKVTLQRISDGTMQPMTLRCHTPHVVAFIESRAEAQQPVFVLYDPARPKRLVLPETLNA